MDLKEQVDKLRQQIESSFDKRLKKLGLTESKGNIRDKDKLPKYRLEERERAKSLIDIFKKEEGSYKQARKKFIEEFSFTLFNRIAALKVMGLKDLIPEPITRRHQHGNRSFAHDIWLENNPEYRSESREGIRDFLRNQFEKQAENIRLFSSDYPYDGLPEESDLLTIIEEFNEIDEEQWKSDDIMGWLYEYYNSSRKQELKDSNEDIEWDKVSLSSQIYTPRWVVEFLLNNSLGKLWLEMHPDSKLDEEHLISNAPDEPTRASKPVKEIKLIDPACGSGNFLLYAYDLFKEMYREEGEIPEKEIPRAILENNIHGVDLDHRSVQIAQLSFYMKVMEDTGEGYSGKMNVVSTDFHLPNYDQARNYFNRLDLTGEMEDIIQELWSDLRRARKFGSLIRIKEKLQQYQKEYTGGGRLGLFEDQFSEMVEKLQNAVSNYASDDGFQTNFLRSQSNRGLQFLELLFGEYDVASANPPYVDSSNYGKEYKDFIRSNFKNNSNYSGNSYAAFFKRLSEMLSETGKIAFICTLASMYIQKYKDLRALILNNFQINQFAEFGLGGSFEDYIRVRPVFMTLDNESGNRHNSNFYSLNQYSSTKLQSSKKEFLINALEANIHEEEDKHLYEVDQEKLKKIDGWPFIYWISDDFREKFKEKPLREVAKPCKGMFTGNNLRFLRYWWEIDYGNSSDKNTLNRDSERWVPYTKGGPWKKWYGNIWCIVDWENNGKKLIEYEKSGLRNEEYFFEEGITYSNVGSKGSSFRYLPPGHIFDSGGPAIFPKSSDKYYTLALLNTKLTAYILDCLNPTVNSTTGDLFRVPYTEPSNKREILISHLSRENVEKAKNLLIYNPTERLFDESPLEYGEDVLSPTKSFDQFFNHKNKQIAKILINEALIDEIIFNIYELSQEDRKDVLRRQGMSAGQHPISDSAKKKFLAGDHELDEANDFVQSLSLLDPTEQELEEKRTKLLNTYEDVSKDTEAVRELSKEFQINPLTVCEWIEESKILPEKKVKDHAQKYILVLAREVLMEDEDGIAPLVDFSGERTLQDRIEQRLFEEKNFTQKYIKELEDFLGYNINKYIQEHFFEDESNILNLFLYQPKTPFIWQLSSGEDSGFEVATIVYKWNRDRLISIKNRYLEKRREMVQRKLAKLGDPIETNDSEDKQEQEERDESPEAQKKREKYRTQLEEIEEFEEKVIDLLESGYDPVLEDGVGYNIAPLQKRDMLKYDPLTSSQLEKFLNADWGSRAEDDKDA